MLTQLRFNVRILLTLAIVLCALPTLTVVAQTDSGWKSSSGKSAGFKREDKKKPFAAAATTQPAPGAPAPQPGADITPVQGGLAPVDAGITRARVTKGSGALPQDNG